MSLVKRIGGNISLLETTEGLILLCVSLVVRRKGKR